MGVRVATLDDLDAVIALAFEFAKSSPFTINEVKVQVLAIKLINEGHVLYHPDGGFIAFTLGYFPYGDDAIATELAWWVTPESRSKKVGQELLEFYEKTAKELGCAMVVVSSLDEEVGKYYEKKGYTLSERAYMKKI